MNAFAALPAATLGALVAGAMLAGPVTGQTIAIEGGLVHTMQGAPLENATILIRDGLVAEVGSGVSVPPGAIRIDARGRQVTPGFFDSSTGLGLVEVASVEAAVDDAVATSSGTEPDFVAAAFNVTDGLNPNSMLLPVNRIGGVTTAVSRPSGGLIAGQGVVIDLAGRTPAELIVRSPVAMFARIGEGAEQAGGGARAGATLRLRQVLDDARFYARNRAAFDRGETRDLAASRLDLEALQPVLAGELPLAIEAHRASDIRTALAIADEYDLDLILMGATEAWMLAEEIAAAGVPAVLKVLQNLPDRFEILGARYDNAAILRAAGVRIALTPLDSHNARNIKQEAGNAVAYGLPHDEALRAITLYPAQIWGVADTHGSIEPGKVANLVVWGGDPLELLTPVEHVLIEGQQIPLVSRQTELRDRYRDPADALRAYPR